jgi:MFS family permease
MLRNRWFNTSVTPRKDFLGVFILLLNAFTWYYMTILVIDAYLKLFSVAPSATVTVWVTYYGTVIASSIIGAIIPNTSRARFLYLWMSIGIVCSFLPAFSFIPPQVWSSALGFALGLGMPACLTYFANHSAIESRGKTGGIIFLSFSLSAALLAVVFTQLNFIMSLLLFALWRGIGLLAFIPLRTSQEAMTEKKRRVPFAAVFRDRSLCLYLIAWTMFILIDRFEWSLSGRILSSSLITIAAIGPILGSVAAFVGGILSDRVGRKKVAISGFVALGLAYAVPGLAPDLLVSWYIYLAVDGVAWGILFVTFLLTLWGDLSQNGGSEKYYVIGAAPYYFTGIIESILNTYVLEIPPYAAFSLASIFLFIAVLPLLFAPETLPEKKIEIRRLKGYLEQASKLREKC